MLLLSAHESRFAQLVHLSANWRQVAVASSCNANTSPFSRIALWFAGSCISRMWAGLLLTKWVWVSAGPSYCSLQLLGFSVCWAGEEDHHSTLLLAGRVLQLHFLFCQIELLITRTERWLFVGPFPGVLLCLQHSLAFRFHVNSPQSASVLVCAGKTIQIVAFLAGLHYSKQRLRMVSHHLSVNMRGGAQIAVFIA